MTKSVCMFVWNHFTNDARVLRECTALSESGYNVDLICIDDPSDEKLKKHEVFNENFHVYRVRRYPVILEKLNSIFRFVKKQKWFLLIIASLWLFSLYNYLYPTLIITAMFALIYNSKFRALWIRSNIFFRMVGKGYLKKYDVYHANDLNTLMQGYICAKWRIKRRKLIYDSHEVQTSRTGYDSPIHGKLEAFLIKKIDSMIVENDTRAKYNEDLYGFYPNVIHNYPFKKNSEVTELIDLHEKLNLPPSEKILLYQGGIQIGRGLEKLLEAVPLFKEGTLVFIGDGKQKPELLKYVEENNLQSCVKFIPKVPLQDLPKYTGSAYLGFQVLNNICFNHWSASSNKLFEYMMGKVPVIACSFPEIKKVVTSENVGICVDSHDPIDIARGVNELLIDIDKRNRMSENCWKAKEKYNWENEKQILLNIYGNVL